MFIVFIFAATKKKRLPAARLHFTLRRFCTALIIIFSHAFCTAANYFSTESPVLLILIFSCLAVGRTL